MPTSGSCDDGLGIGSPDEGLRLLVVDVDEAVDRLLQVDERMEDAMLEPSSGELGEEALDGIQPSKARRPSIRSLEGTRPAGRGGEHEVGVKWKVQRGWRASQALTLVCLWAA